MPAEKISIQRFLELAAHHPVFDVRSPGEFTHAHIPGAYALPLFTDDERAVVGTAYKQQSREAAIKIGLGYFGGKMSAMVEEVEKIAGSFKSVAGKHQTSQAQPSNANCVLVHCWRGGMRSAGVAWLLDLYGFKVYTLAGGYKAYRKWVLSQFESPHCFRMIGGFTGSGKTLLIKDLIASGQPVIDLEGLAHHKGSALGSLGEGPQPKQEMFENLLARELSAFDETQRIWVEDESQRIGNLQIPMPLWFQLRKSPVYFLDIPFEARLDYLVEEYGKYDRERMVDAILRIRKRLGGMEATNAITCLVENDHRGCFRILLGYYDKWYLKGLYNRENFESLVNKIPAQTVDTNSNIQKLLSCDPVTS